MPLTSERLQKLPKFQVHGAGGGTQVFLFASEKGHGESQQVTESAETKAQLAGLLLKA